MRRGGQTDKEDTQQALSVARPCVSPLRAFGHGGLAVLFPRPEFSSATPWYCVCIHFGHALCRDLELTNVFTHVHALGSSSPESQQSLTTGFLQQPCGQQSPLPPHACVPYVPL